MRSRRCCLDKDGAAEMARKSIESRLDRILDRLLRPGSFERREHDLPDHLRAVLTEWRERTDRIISGQKIEHGESWYPLFAAGELETPPMPRVLSDALGLNDPPVITENMTLAEAAQVYSDFAQEAD